MGLNIDTDETSLHIQSFSLAMAKFKNAINNTVLNFFPSTLPNALGNRQDLATTVNLLKIGRSRNVPFFEGEDIDAYRARVIDSFKENRARGSKADIIRVMLSFGFEFNSHRQGLSAQIPTGPKFNLIVRTFGGAIWDGTFKFNGPAAGGIKWNSPGANNINLELIQSPAITTKLDTDIRNALKNIIRGSSRVGTIDKLVPIP